MKWILLSLALSWPSSQFCPRRWDYTLPVILLNTQKCFFFISSKFLPFQINNEKNNTVRIWLKVCDHMKILFLIYSHFGVIITSTLLVKLSLEGVNLI